ncbi:MAG TPA: N-acetylmuramoyl-L-alanine amidase [Saprospiraceae bacterium]|nr:N-acetylmuramoyl-L-alanine amidase [Saprospiraceae bacterium]
MLFSRIVTGFLVGLALNASGQKSITTNKQAAKPAVSPKTYVTAVSRAGDDVAALLTRYGLFQFECNLTQFFKLNNLRKGSKITPSTTYKLPVEVVTYNGKSIRTTLNISDWRVAKRIETYNKFTLEQGLRVDNFVQTKRLWVPWHELNCPPKEPAAKPAAKPAKEEIVVAEASLTKSRNSLSVPPGLGEKGIGKVSRDYAIFGKKYQHTPLISSKLKGKVFYIVSGHGGPDSGARGERGGRTLCEDEYAYDVSLRVLRLLLSHGATAYMIVRDPSDGIRDTEFLNCDEDEVVWGNLVVPRDQKQRLQQRCDVINDFTKQNAKAGLTDQTLIEIHVDSRSKEHKTDVFFYYRPDSESSHSLALHMQKVFLLKYLKKRNQRGYTGTVTSRNLYMLKETITPKAVYIELANIRNSWDQQRLVMKNNRQAVANWICEGLLTK